MNGVKGVFYSESYAAPKVAVTNNANVYTTGIYDSSDIDYKGEGMVVAILDTGLDHTHEAFQEAPSSPAWDKAYVEDKVASGKLSAIGSADEFYYNSKVPFAYDYADDDPNVFPSYSSHGTHVAGIVAGKSDYVVNEETGEKFIGVAPEAQLMICKVFTDNLDSDSLGGANTMDILAALNDCTQMDVDVINMSLGSSAGFADEKSDTYINGIYDAIKKAGISLIVAASNDYSSGFGGGNGTNLASNPDSGTVGSPSTYAAALSVASINGQKASYISLKEKVGNEYV
ncbi:MAG: S8 family serine peptidase, partial [Clostridia bacterium]|nr:S8 family serine peptidase [Clostridia bacterium]